MPVNYFYACQNATGSGEPTPIPLHPNAARSGWRIPEVMLTWNNINFEHRLVTVEAAYSKNGEARSVPMSLRLTETLAEIKMPDSTAPIFLNSEGKPYRNVAAAFNAAVMRAGIKDFAFHDRRHTFASRLVRVGVDLTTVKELMGHKTISMSLRYSHLSPAHKHAVIAIFDQLTTYSDAENVHPPKSLILRFGGVSVLVCRLDFKSSDRG